MISRRTLLGTSAGVVVVGGAIAGTAALGGIDDVADALGITPKSRPDERDEALLATVALDQGRLLDLVSAVEARYTDLGLAAYVSIATEQLEAVGGSERPATDIVVADTAEAALSDVTARWSAVSTSRATDCVAAIAPELARVLASMSAGAAQCARQLRVPA